MDTVSTATVHVSIKIALDAIWDTCVRHGEEPAVREDWLAMMSGEVKGVAGYDTLVGFYFQRECQRTYIAETRESSVVPSPRTRAVSVI
jgi:hypothetical protein